MAPRVRKADVAVAEATHNLSGQRLGPKGQGTRERIIAAMLRLLEADDETPITLSAISRESSIRMSNLYLYFPDLGELLLAVLARVIDQQEPAFLQRMRQRWPDATLGQDVLAFVQVHFAFWRRHCRLLRMRNDLADAGDSRLIAYRGRVSALPIHLFVLQMDGMAEAPDTSRRSIATVLFTGLERVATVVTHPDFAEKAGIPHDADRAVYINALAEAEAKVIEFTIRAMRTAA